MTDAPDRIWLTTTNSGRVDEFTMWLDDLSHLPPEAPRTAYIRADLHDAQLAALREENRELAMQIIASDGQAHDAYSKTLALRDRVEALEAENLRATGRLCVTCGKLFPKEQPRNAAGKDCPEPDICSIDMTIWEAMLYWRQKAHDDREAARAALKADQ